MLDEDVAQRIRCALNHEEGDRVPIWDFIDNRAVVDHFAPGEPDLAKAMVKVYHGLGIDLCRGWGAAYREQDEGPSSAGHRVTGRSHWVVDYAIKSVDDLRRYQPEPVNETWLRDEWTPWNLRRREELEPYTMWVPTAGCGFNETYALMGQQLFSYAIYDAPAELERIMHALNERAVAMVRAAAEADLCPLFFIGDDIAYKGTLLFSPEYLRRTFVPMLSRVCQPLKDAGIKVIFHSDGNVMEILDDMIEAGIDGLNPIEPLAGMDIGLLKKRYGKNLVLVGNVDCSQTLPLGSVEDVVEATRQCIRTASGGGGHFIGSSSEILPCTPLENVLAFFGACREYGAYPIRA